MQVRRRPPLRQPDAQEPVVEVVLVGGHGARPYLEPLEHHEGRVEDRRSASTSSGATRAIVAAVFKTPCTETTARAKPRASALESPMKIFAGW